MPAAPSYSDWAGLCPVTQTSKPFVLFLNPQRALQDEAFQLWQTEWASLYSEGSTAAKLINGIVDGWYLVSLVDNDFVNGDLYRIFGLENAAAASS